MKTKNNINFQPEQTITDQSTLIVNFFGEYRWGEGEGVKMLMPPVLGYGYFLVSSNNYIQ